VKAAFTHAGMIDTVPYGRHGPFGSNWRP
jgi:hypothetical protein